MPALTVPPLTDVLALRLRADAGRRLVLRIVLTVGWVAALVVSVASDTRPCSAAEPTICGPDLVFAWSAIPLFAAPALIWIATPAGLVAGITFAVADLLFDDLHAARVAWGAYGALCVAVALWWASGAGRGALADGGDDGPRVHVGDVAAGAVDDDVEAGRHRRPGELPDDVDGRAVADVVVAVGMRGLRVLAAGGIVLVGVVGAVAYPVLQHGEDAHLERAQPATAVVTRHDTADSTIDVRVGEASFTDVEVLDTDTYPLEGSVPVHVDPADPTWVQLDAEPHDHTFWLALGLAAVVVGAALGWQELRARETLRRLVLDPQPGVRGLGVLAGEVLLVWPLGSPTGGLRMPVAEVPVGARGPWNELLDAVTPPARPWADDPDDVDDRYEDDDWDDEDDARYEDDERLRPRTSPAQRARPTPVTLLGDVRDGGCVIGVLDGEVVLSGGPVHVLPGRWARRLRWRGDQEGPRWWERLPPA